MQDPCQNPQARPDRRASRRGLAEQGHQHNCLVVASRQLRQILIRIADGLTRVAARLPEEPPEFTKGSAAQKPLKIFIDGVFDLTHFGHMNAFRQARERGGYLIVGVNADESVLECKGARPVLTDSERQAAVAACRFVDEVLPATPYVMTAEYIEHLVEVHGVDYFVHGDDPCIVDGKDVYEAARKAGRFITIPRTDGVSTTDIVGRLLVSTKDHHQKGTADCENELARKVSETMCETNYAIGPTSNFLVTSRLINAFSKELALHHSANHDCRVVYVDGSWDMFHAAHVEFLRKAAQFGDFLLVGVQSDSVVNAASGCNYPIMTMHERLLSVLGCRYVDDVLLKAPLHISAELIATMKISIVVVCKGLEYHASAVGNNRHQAAEKIGIVVEIEQENTLACNEIVQRVLERREEVVARHFVKSQKEDEWYRKKHGL